MGYPIVELVLVVVLLPVVRISSCCRITSSCRLAPYCHYSEYGDGHVGMVMMMGLTANLISIPAHLMSPFMSC
jgi:hypothetical protein